MSRRGKKGLQVSRGERYALLSDEVARSQAYHALPDWARSVLFALMLQYNGHNNGNLSLPVSEARALGVPAQWKLYAGLRLCEWADLIVCSRRGKLHQGTKLPSLFALTWRGIDDTGVAYDHGVGVCPLPSHAWAKWKRPDDWQARVQGVQRQMRGTSRLPAEIAHTPLSGDGPSTLSVEGKGYITPDSVEKETCSIAPHCQEASKISAPAFRSWASQPARRSTRASPQGSLARGADDLARRVLKLAAVQPHLSPADIARTFNAPGIDSVAVAQILERHAESTR